ncbi:MAG: M14 family zinc carboxypeptidase [Pseudobdellovibrionaceae bacterium]
MNYSCFVTDIGKSTLGQSINFWNFNSNQKTEILIIGGVHGDELEGVELAEALVKEIITCDKEVNLKLKDKIGVIPCLNPDGKILNKRSNYNNVDLNRNLPTSNWKRDATNERYQPGKEAGSEPETKAFLVFLEKIRPNIIISLHSYSKNLVLYPVSELSLKYKSAIDNFARKLTYPVVEAMDYDIFGNLSRFGIENKYVTMTLELPKGFQLVDIKNKFLPPLIELLNEVSN